MSHFTLHISEYEIAYGRNTKDGYYVRVFNIKNENVPIVELTESSHGISQSDIEDIVSQFHIDPSCVRLDFGAG